MTLYDADIGRVVSGISKAVIIGIAVGAGALLALVAFLALVVLRLKRRAEEERKKNPFGTAILIFTVFSL